MEEEHGMKVIARIHNDFPTKFGIPHQSNRLDALKAKIVFEPEYRVPEAFRGLEEYDYIWLIWQFSETVRENWFRLSGRRGLVEIHVWVYLPRDLHFVQTASGFLQCVSKK